MKKFALFPALLLLCLALASCQTTVHYFYGNGCTHCANVEASGVLEKVAGDNITVLRYEIYFNSSNQQLFNQYGNALSLSRYDRGVPLAVIECNSSLSYLAGDSPIISSLEEFATTCKSFNITNGISPESPSQHKITLGSIVIGAAVDSINPCAFAVLIFLIVTMLAMGSKKRMLRAAIVYILAVYVTYFLAGLGIFKAIQSLTSITHYVYIGSGIVILAVGLIEIRSFFWPGGFSLKIPESTKPTIEAIARKGTLPAVILLGVLVSLFELPCTGGIYLAILTLMSANKSFAISYLLLYNLIFILPLIVISMVIYKGMSPELLEEWRLKERRWMKLAAGLVLLALGIYILVF